MDNKINLNEKDDFFFMKEALKEAKIAYKKNEVPVGAVLVHEGQILAKAHNLVEQSRSCCAHAEMLCLKEANQYLKNWRLLDATLYCILEPCLMCAGAMLLSRIKRLVYGAKDHRMGAAGTLIDAFSGVFPIHRVEVKGGVMAEEAAKLMQDFFNERRKGCTKNYLMN